MTNSHIPNLQLRHFAGASDFYQMAIVINTCRETDQSEWVDTAETLAMYYKNLVNCDPYQDMILAEVAGQLVGHSRCEWADQPGAGRVYFLSLFLLPAWHGKGIGELLLQWMEEHINQLAEQHGTGANAFMECYMPEMAHERIAILIHHGFQKVRHYQYLLRLTLENLPDAPLPAGIELITPQPEYYRAIWEASLEIGRESPGFVEQTEAHYQAWLLDKQYFQPQYWQIAWDQERDEVAGYMFNVINTVENEHYCRQRAYVFNYGVREAWRQRGLWRSLLIYSMKMLKAAGMTETAIDFESTSSPWLMPILERYGFQSIKSIVVYRRAA